VKGGVTRAYGATLGRETPASWSPADQSPAASYSFEDFVVDRHADGHHAIGRGAVAGDADEDHDDIEEDIDIALAANLAGAGASETVTFILPEAAAAETNAAAALIQRWFRRCSAQQAAAHEEIRAMLVAKRAALRAMEERAARQEKMGKRVARARAEDRADSARIRAQTEMVDAKLHVTEFLASYSPAVPATVAATAAAVAPNASSYMSPRIPPAHPNGVSAAVVAAATVSPAPLLLLRGGSGGGLRASRSILTASMQSLCAYSEASPRSGVAGNAGQNEEIVHDTADAVAPTDASVFCSSKSTSASAEVADFSTFIREVAARVIQHYARPWLAGRASASAAFDHEAENMDPEYPETDNTTTKGAGGGVSKMREWRRQEKSSNDVIGCQRNSAAGSKRGILTPLVPSAMLSPYSMYSGPGSPQHGPGSPQHGPESPQQYPLQSAAVQSAKRLVTASSSPASTPRTALPTPAARHRGGGDAGRSVAGGGGAVAVRAVPSPAPVPTIELTIPEEVAEGTAGRVREMELQRREEIDEGDGEEEPQPRMAMPAMLLERAVEAAADASAAAEAATDASFEDAVEAISPAKSTATTRSVRCYTAGHTPTADAEAESSATPTGRVPPADVGASLAEDKLASILSYLDAVEHNNTLHGAASCAGLGLAASAAWEGVGSVASSVVSAAPSMPNPTHYAPRLPTAAVAVHRGDWAAMPPASLAGDSACKDAPSATAASGVGPASSSGALATATSVYEGVRARMEALKNDVARRDALVTKLEAELRAAYDRSVVETAAQLAGQQANHDAATQRHLKFADRLLADKDELATKCTELSDNLSATEARHGSAVQELKGAWSGELKRHKKAWDATERSTRDAWEADKTREVKELTIRGLEPEVQRLVQKHRGEVRDLQEAHREDLRRQNVELTQRHEEYVRGLRERVVRDHEDELEKERLAAAARARDQAERYEAQLHAQRQRVAADAEAASERVEAGRREDRSRHEETLTRQNLEATQREEKALEQTAAAAESARRRHEADLAAVQGRLDDESAAWRAKVAAKAHEALAEKEREIRSKAAAERDAEIEAVANRLRAEADADRRKQTGALADRHVSETKEARGRAEKAEHAAAVAARAESAASGRAAAAEAELAAVKHEAAARRDAAHFLEAQVSSYDEKSATRERDLRAAFEDRLRALEGAAVAAEKRAATAEADLGRVRERTDEEVAALESRVRGAIGRKDDAIGQLSAQLAAAQQQLAATEAVLQRQQQDMAMMIGGDAD
jgi:5-azacytidine-induced protein 1